MGFLYSLAYFPSDDDDGDGDDDDDVASRLFCIRTLVCTDQLLTPKFIHMT